MNLYTYVENNPLRYVDPSGMAPVLIGYVYIISGTTDNGKTETYIGSTAQELKKRMGNHKWKEFVRNPDTTVSAIEVKAELDVSKSNKGTYLGARNEALRAAEQELINNYTKKGIELLNLDNAATTKNMDIWNVRHSVEFDMNSAKVALKGGQRIGSFLGVFDTYNMYLQINSSQYEFAPYYMQDEGGVFTIGTSKDGCFSKTVYYKTYQSGSSAGNKVYINKEEFNFWKAEGEALWGYLDAWGKFVPGLLNPTFEESKGIYM